MDIAIIKALIQFVGFLWVAFIVLLVITAVMLVLGSKHRYVVGIVAFSLSAAISLICLVGIGFADSAVMDIVIDKVGTWILFVIPHVVEPTVWPWIVLVASVACIVMLAVTARRAKAIEPAIDELTETDAAEEAKTTEAVDAAAPKTTDSAGQSNHKADDKQ